MRNRQAEVLQTGYGAIGIGRLGKGPDLHPFHRQRRRWQRFLSRRSQGTVGPGQPIAIPARRPGRRHRILRAIDAGNPQIGHSEAVHETQVIGNRGATFRHPPPVADQIALCLASPGRAAGIGICNGAAFHQGGRRPPHRHRRSFGLWHRRPGLRRFRLGFRRRIRGGRFRRGRHRRRKARGFSADRLPIRPQARHPDQGAAQPGTLKSTAAAVHIFARGKIGRRQFRRHRHHGLRQSGSADHHRQTNCRNPEQPHCAPQIIQRRMTKSGGKVKGKGLIWCQTSDRRRPPDPARYSRGHSGARPPPP